MAVVTNSFTGLFSLVPHFVAYVSSTQSLTKCFVETLAQVGAERNVNADPWHMLWFGLFIVGNRFFDVTGISIYCIPKICVTADQPGPNLGKVFK